MPSALESNSYAVAYRLLGVRGAALGVAAIAAERVRERFDSGGGLDVDAVRAEVWLPMLIDYTVDESVRSNVLAGTAETDDSSAGLREALRRRLVRASRGERVVGALVHLAGYPPAQVATMLRMDEAQVDRFSSILAPPPGIDYRLLGDPELIGSAPTHEPTMSFPLPYPSTIAVAVVILIIVLVATQCHGQRPSIVENGSMQLGTRVAVSTYPR